jgi:hypothetical protein
MIDAINSQIIQKTSINIYIYIYKHTSVYTPMCMYMNTCIHAPCCKYMNTHTDSYLNAHMHLHIHIERIYKSNKANGVKFCYQQMICVKNIQVFSVLLLILATFQYI